tara:strand:+ start:15094 stop:15264 length:171 start_codon:yes stop_codon:yes gene_type:complete
MSSELPKHGVTGLALKEEDVELFMDYIIDKEPQEAKIHTGALNKKMPALEMPRFIS